jgi:hypothetical protein
MRHRHPAPRHSLHRLASRHHTAENKEALARQQAANQAALCGLLPNRSTSTLRPNFSSTEFGWAKKNSSCADSAEAKDSLSMKSKLFLVARKVFGHSDPQSNVCHAGIQK